MPVDSAKPSSISKAKTDEKIGEFWDTHDFTDFDDPNAPDVPFEMRRAVPNRKRGISKQKEKR
jgi:hypothetical protein